MSPPRLDPIDPTDQPLEIFRVLYPIFKEEVFKRREHMIRLTAFANTVLVLFLVTLQPLTSWETAPSLTPWLAISGIGIFSGLFAYFILQQAERHRMAKQQLIELEKSVSLYQEGRHLSDKPLFPPNWQIDWTTDRSVQIYLTILAAMTVLVIGSMLIQL